MLTRVAKQGVRQIVVSLAIDREGIQGRDAREICGRVAEVVRRAYHHADVRVDVSVEMQTRVDVTEADEASRMAVTKLVDFVLDRLRAEASEQAKS